MPQGLQTHDASGNLVIDLTTQMAKILGVTNTGTSGGSVTGIVGFDQGTPFVFVQMSAISDPDIDADRPSVSLGGTTTSSSGTVTWTWLSSDSPNDHIIYWGVY